VDDWGNRKDRGGDIMSYKNIELELDFPRAIIRLNRPEKRNALSIELRNEMVNCLDRIGEDDQIIAGLITGNGPAFCAGFDLEEFKNPDPDHVNAIKESSDRFHMALARFPKPLVAAVNGPAMAGGFDLALLCDIRLASERALFGHPELRFGSPVFYALLKEIVGGGMARDLCLSGRNMDAAEAHRIGLVSKLSPADKLMEESMTMLGEICKTPLNTLIREKKRILELAGNAVEEVTATEGPSFVDIIRDGMGK